MEMRFEYIDNVLVAHLQMFLDRNGAENFKYVLSERMKPGEKIVLDLEKLVNIDNYVLILYLHSAYEGNGTPLQYSCLENPMDRGAWWAAVHGVAKSRTRLSNFTFTFNFHALEKEMATHSSILAWRIPGMGEPGGLPSMGSHRVGHD